MQKDTALKLNELNARFYARACASFSETRRSPWPGWERILHLAEQRFGLVADSKNPTSRHTETVSKPVVTPREESKAEPGATRPCAGRTAEAQHPAPLRVLDLACGNLRFERTLVQHYGADALSLHAVDSCDLLLAEEPEDFPVAYRHLDIVSGLLEDKGLQALSDWSSFDLSCSFGFMHHIPGFENRLAFLRALSKRGERGSLVAVSFWRFMANEKLASKAYETTSRALSFLAEEGLSQADLEENDFLVGWQDESDLFRYCHHFDEDELDRLVDALQDSMRLVARFKADGRTEDLNHYLVFEVKE